jgi:hypothetical protein
MRIGPLLQFFAQAVGSYSKEHLVWTCQKTSLEKNVPVAVLCLSRLCKIEDSLQQKLAKGLSPDFQMAYRQVESGAIRLAFDIEKLDSLLNLSSHGSVCILGERTYTQLLMDRLCVHSMLPKRHGGIGEGYSKIIAIDAGNCIIRGQQRYHKYIAQRYPGDLLGERCHDKLDQKVRLQLS